MCKWPPLRLAKRDLTRFGPGNHARIIKSSEDFNPTSVLHNQPLHQIWCASHINTTLQTSLAFTVEMMWDKIKHPQTIKTDSSNPATISTAQFMSIIKIIEWYNKLGKYYNRLPCGNTKMRREIEPPMAQGTTSPQPLEWSLLATHPQACNRPHRRSDGTLAHSHELSNTHLISQLRWNGMTNHSSLRDASSNKGMEASLYRLTLRLH